MQQLFLKISGDVHGVFFRDETRKLAQSLGLTGWVRNAHDSTVEILAQGDKESLKKLEEWAKNGPPSAKVEKIEKNYSEITEKFNEFKIIY
jgi:acylphosphatase